VTAFSRELERIWRARAPHVICAHVRAAVDLRALCLVSFTREGKVSQQPVPSLASPGILDSMPCCNWLILAVHGPQFVGDSAARLQGRCVRVCRETRSTFEHFGVRWVERKYVARTEAEEVGEITAAMRALEGGADSDARGELLEDDFVLAATRVRPAAKTRDKAISAALNAVYFSMCWAAAAGLLLLQVLEASLGTQMFLLDFPQITACPGFYRGRTAKQAQCRLASAPRRPRMPPAAALSTLKMALLSTPQTSPRTESQSGGALGTGLGLAAVLALQRARAAQGPSRQRTGARSARTARLRCQRSTSSAPSACRTGLSFLLQTIRPALFDCDKTLVLAECGGA